MTITLLIRLSHLFALQLLPSLQLLRRGEATGSGQGQEGADASQSRMTQTLQGPQHPAQKIWLKKPRGEGPVKSVSPEPSLPSIPAQVFTGRYRGDRFCHFSLCPRELITPEGVAGGGWQGGDDAQPSLLSPGAASDNKNDYSPPGTLHLPSGHSPRAQLSQRIPPFNNRQHSNASPKVEQQRGNGKGFALITRGGFKGDPGSPSRAEHPCSAGIRGGAPTLLRCGLDTGCVSLARWEPCPAGSQPCHREFRLRHHKAGCCSRSHTAKLPEPPPL